MSTTSCPCSQADVFAHRCTPQATRTRQPWAYSGDGLDDQGAVTPLRSDASPVAIRLVRGQHLRHHAREGHRVSGAENLPAASSNAPAARLSSMGSCRCSPDVRRGFPEPAAQTHTARGPATQHAYRSTGPQVQPLSHSAANSRMPRDPVKRKASQQRYNQSDKGKATSSKGTPACGSPIAHRSEFARFGRVRDCVKVTEPEPLPQQGAWCCSCCCLCVGVFARVAAVCASEGPLLSCEPC